MIVEIINTTDRISGLVDWLVARHEPTAPSSPTIYIDLEGVALSRDGSLSILTLLTDTEVPAPRVMLIDVHVLGAQAFNTAGYKGKTLKDILQNANIPKVFFDFAHFGVALQGVKDVQLMESATRNTTASRQYVSGLAKCIETKLVIPGGKANWQLAKEKGERLFAPQHGGSYEVFNQRPPSEDIISHCVGDVQYLPELRATSWRLQTSKWQDLIREASQARVAASQDAGYLPRGPNRAVSPWSAEQHWLLDRWAAGW